MYATGGHFQAVFQRDHSFFIDLAKELDIESSPILNSMNEKQMTSSTIASPIKKRLNSKDSYVAKKKKIEGNKTCAATTSLHTNSKQGEASYDFESRLGEIKKIKAKDRSDELKREYNTLMKKRNRLNEDNLKRENEKQKARMAKKREDEANL